MKSSSALKYVKDTLGKWLGDNDNKPTIQTQLLCVSRLRVVALAIGVESTQKELVPFIQELAEEAVCSAGKTPQPQI